MQGGLSRDRDAAGRARNARPRDALGRPLERTPGATADPDDPPLPPGQALERAQQLLDAGRPFAAHEVLEAVWKSTAGPERSLWRGLAQLCVALTHVQRGNERGAVALFERAAETLADAPALHGVQPAVLARWARAAAGAPQPPATPRLVG